MRQFPNEIEADLLFRGIDINEWHQGRMSSRRLLVLIDAIGADPDSTFARERRDGDWSLQEYIDAALVNELRRLRADQAAIHANHKLNIAMIEGPMEQREQEKLNERVSDLRAHVIQQMNKAKAKAKGS